MSFPSHALVPRALTLIAVVTLCAVASTALADGISPDRATPIQREQAQRRFTRGRELFNQKKYAESLQELRASHEIVSSPNTRLMIARCYRELGRLVQAYAELGRTSVEARELERTDRRYGQAADTAEQERKALESQLAFVRVEVTHAEPATSLTVDGEEIRRAGWGEPTPAMPGSAQVVVETPGRAPLRKTLALQAGQHATVTIDASTAPAPPAAEPHVASTAATPPMRTWAYVAGGVGVAGLATFAIAGTMANGTYNDLESACGGGPCPPTRQSDIDAGRRQQTIANIGLAVGVVGLGAGVTMFLLSKPSDTAPNAALVLSPGWVGLRGRM